MQEFDVYLMHHNEYDAKLSSLVSEIRTCQWEKALEILNSNPSLVSENYYDEQEQTFLLFVLKQNKGDYCVKDKLLFAVKVIELDPAVNFDLNGEEILSHVLSYPDCEERTLLLLYLLYCGVTYAPNTQIGNEITKILDHLFSIGLEVIKMQADAGTEFSKLPQEIDWKIAFNAIFVRCPSLSKFPPSGLIQIMHAWLEQSKII